MTDDSPFRADLRIRRVEIIEGVTNIGYAAFADCSNLLSISIPGSVSSIGDPYSFVFQNHIVGAFENCTSLTSVALPEGVTTVYARNFYNCVNLSEVTLPSTIESIQYYAFSQDKKLKKVTFPSGMTTVGEKAFSQSGLTEAVLPEGLTMMGQFAFEFTYITRIHIPGTLSNWDRGGFYALYSNVTELEIEEGIKKIPDDTFSFTITGFSELTLPESVEEIGMRGLNIKGLETVRFGKNFKYNKNCFSKAVNIKNLEISSENEYCHSYDNVIYNSDYSDILWFNEQRTGTLTFPKQLKGFTVKKFKNDNYSSVLFSNIEAFDIEEGAENFVVDNGVLYTSDRKTLYKLPPKYNQNSYVIPDSVEKIQNHAFYSIQVSVNIPAALKEIGDYAFYEVKTFNGLNLPEGLLSIGKYAFANAQAFTSLELPQSLEAIGEAAFANIRFDYVRLPDELEEVSSDSFVTKRIYVGAKTHIVGSKTIASDEITVSKQNPYYSSYDGAVYTKDLSELVLIPSNKTRLSVPKETNKFNTYPTMAINVDADNPYFSSYDGILYNNGCTELQYIPTGRTSFTIPKETQRFKVLFSKKVRVTVDEDNPYLKSDGPFLMNKNGDLIYNVSETGGDVVIPDGVTRMTYLPGMNGAGAKLSFMNEITSITYPEGFKSLYSDNPRVEGSSSCMVRDCNKLKEITIPGSVDIVDAFWRLPDLEKVNLGEGVQEVRWFDDCYKLKSLTLPSSVKYYSVNLTNDVQNTSDLENLVIKNPYCVIKEQARIKPSATISGYCGSTAHNLAKKRKTNFVSLGHSYLDWYVSTPATYEHEGVERRDCGYCDHYEERPIPRLVKETNTATFMADGKVVSVVNFTSAMSSIEEPPVPAKDRYLGEWEPYTLGDEDIVINAKYTLITSDNAEEIDTDSTVDYYYNTDDVLFNIKASSKAKTVKSTISQSIPLDIVLVVDQSGSMDETLGGSKKKVDALKEAANAFINKVYDNANHTGASHRIAIAGFGLSGTHNGYQRNENTELLTNSKKTPVVFHELKPADYASALLDVKTEKSDLASAVSTIEAKGATAADLGLEMAKNIYANSDSEGRQRVVVFMTDGEPTYSSSFQKDVANSAIDNARVLKDTYGASVYSVGVMNNPSSQVDTFMKAVSSDYPDASSMNRLGSMRSEAYYISVNNADTLEGVFRTITTESLSHTAAFDKLTLIKTLSRYVTLTSEQEHELRVSLIRKYGITNDDITVNRKENGKTEIKVVNITPYEVDDGNGNYTYEASMSFFASLNQNASVAGAYAVDTEDSGVMLGDTVGYETTFGTSTVTLDSDKSRVVYIINNEVYDICEGGKTPDTDFPLDWTFSGWSGSGSERTATLTKPDRTIIWHTYGKDITQTYKEGWFITPPSVDDKSENEKFLSWDKSIPTAMPDENLEFTAVYGGHVHKYTSEVIKPATCEESGSVRYTCDCGDTYTETVPALGHNYKAVTGSVDSEQTDDSRCTFVCTHCGKRYTYALNYEVRESVNWLWSRMLFNFTLSDDNLENVGVQPDGTINIRIPLSEIQYSKAKNVYVTREENGRSISVPSEIKDGYLIIKANHFSPYSIILGDENTYITSQSESVDLTESFSTGVGDTLAQKNNYTQLGNFKLLGVQKKDESLSSKDMRFVTVVNTSVLRDADEYGYLVATTSSSKRDEAVSQIGTLEYGKAKVANVVCGKDNKISGNYGLLDEDTPYKYITMSINDVPDEAALMVRFYVKKGDRVFYPKYTNKAEEVLDGCVASWEAMQNAG